MNNLLPILDLARRRHHVVKVLTGGGVELDSAIENESGAKTGVTNLMADATMAERLKGLRRALALYRVLCDGVGQHAPQFTSAVRSYAVNIIAELASSIMVRAPLRRLFNEWGPQCLISTTDFWPFEHAVFAEARREGIPSVVVQHGITNRYWWPFVADKLLLWGAPFQKELLTLGAPMERLGICGMVSADGLFSKYGASSKRGRDRVAKSFVILSDAHARGCISASSKFKALLQRAVEARPDIEWSIKLHPAEDDTFYRDMIGQAFPNFRVLAKRTSLQEAVVGADVACTMYSTAGLEAMAMRRPLVVFDVEPIVHDFAWWPKFGGGIYVSSLGALLTFIGSAFEDSQFLAEIVQRQDAFLAQSFANPGRAAEAALDTIEEMAAGGVRRCEVRSGHSGPAVPTQTA